MITHQEVNDWTPRAFSLTRCDAAFLENIRLFWLAEDNLVYIFRYYITDNRHWEHMITLFELDNAIDPKSLLQFSIGRAIESAYGEFLNRELSEGDN